ncbi:MAG: hypothetical protein WKF53_17725 [Rubrobacter sp.]
MDATISEIHCYPLRPESFTEPLFLGASAKKEIAEHLSRSGWLSKASNAAGETPRERPCHVYRGPDGSAWLVRACRRPGQLGTPRGSASAGVIGGSPFKRRIERVIERWREVSEWWEPSGGTDRLLFRVLLCGKGEARAETGTVLDLAYERRGREWTVAGVVD